MSIQKPHGGVRPFHQKSTCLTQLTFGHYVVQNRSRNTPESGVNETLVLHRAACCQPCAISYCRRQGINFRQIPTCSLVFPAINLCGSVIWFSECPTCSLARQALRDGGGAAATQQMGGRRFQQPRHILAKYDCRCRGQGSGLWTLI